MCVFRRRIFLIHFTSKQKINGSVVDAAFVAFMLLMVLFCQRLLPLRLLLVADADADADADGNC